RIRADDVNQQNATDQRWQCQRQLHGDVDKARQAAAPMRQQISQRYAEQANDGDGNARCHDGGPQRRKQTRVGQAGTSLGQPENKGRYRYQQVQGEQPGEPRQRGARGSHHLASNSGFSACGNADSSPVRVAGVSSSKPFSCRISLPCAPSRKLMKWMAPSGLGACFSNVMVYLAPRLIGSMDTVGSPIASASPR